MARHGGPAGDAYLPLASPFTSFAGQAHRCRISSCRPRVPVVVAYQAEHLVLREARNLCIADLTLPRPPLASRADRLARSGLHQQLLDVQIDPYADADSSQGSPFTDAAIFAQGLSRDVLDAGAVGDEPTVEFDPNISASGAWLPVDRDNDSVPSACVPVILADDYGGLSTSARKNKVVEVTPQRGAQRMPASTARRLAARMASR